MVLYLCRKRKGFCILMYFAEIFSVAHWPLVERKDVPSGAPLAYKIYFTNGAHPGLHRPVHLLLMKNITLRICECLGTVGEGTVFHFKKKPSYSVAKAELEQLMCLGPPFLPTSCPQHKKSPPSIALGLK